MTDKTFTYCIHYHFTNHYTNGSTWTSGDLCTSFKARSINDAKIIFARDYPNTTNRTYYIDSCWFCG